MTNTNNKRGDRIAADQAMVNGIGKFLAQLAALPIGGKNMTPADITKVFQDRVTAGQAVITAEAALKAAVKGDRDERANTGAFVRAFRRVVLGLFQEQPDTLAAFGLTAPKPRKLKVAVKAAAVAKNAATRKARGTVGKKKKLAIKGEVPAGNGPEPAPPAPATTTAPAAPKPTG